MLPDSYLHYLYNLYISLLQYYEEVYQLPVFIMYFIQVNNGNRTKFCLTCTNHHLLVLIWESNFWFLCISMVTALCLLIQISIYTLKKFYSLFRAPISCFSGWLKLILKFTCTFTFYCNSSLSDLMLLLLHSYHFISPPKCMIYNHIILLHCPQYCTMCILCLNTPILFQNDTPKHLLNKAGDRHVISGDFYSNKFL